MRAPAKATRSEPARNLFADQPQQAAWFNIDVYGDGSTVIPSDYHPVSVIGNFAWLRVEVTRFESGTANVIASY
jgi:hypothetical protein